MLVVTGSYTGTGTIQTVRAFNQAVTLKFLYIKRMTGGASEGYIIMVGTTTPHTFAGSNGGLVTLNSDGTFTITGTTAFLNNSGDTYSFTAISDSDGLGDVTFGTYTGNGTSQSPNCTLNPVFVLVVGDSGGLPPKFKTPTLTGANSIGLNAATAQTTAITALGIGTFSVGSAAVVNQNGGTFAWMAIADNPHFHYGTYTGNATNPTDYGSGLLSLLSLFTKSASAVDGWHRNDQFSDGQSCDVGSALPTSAGILRFKTNGFFELDNSSPVNANTVVFNWFAFGNLPIFSVEGNLEVIKHTGLASHDPKQIIPIFIRSSVTGLGLTGLTNASSGLVAYYSYNGDTAAHSISLVSASLGTYTSGGFKEIDATNMPGWYQLGIPDTVLASGQEVAIHLSGATNMLPKSFVLQLTASDLDDATALGISRIDAAISTRSTYAGADTAGTTTLLSRLTATRAGLLDNLSNLDAAISNIATAVWGFGTRILTAFGFNVTVGTNNDKTGYALTSAYDPAKTATQTSDLTPLVTTSHFDTSITNLQTHGDANWESTADPDLSANVEEILGIVQTIGGMTITITQPILNADTLLITLGDDYKNADGRAFGFTFTGSPDISGSTGRLKICSAYSTTAILTQTATVVDSTHAYFELTSTQTISLAAATRFEVEFTLTNGDIWTPITLDTGKIQITGQAT